MLTLEKKLKTRVRAVAKKLGLKERDIISRAVSAYLSELGEWRTLQQELRLWDFLSAETMRKYSW
jgi:hypothetical protein